MSHNSQIGDCYSDPKAGLLAKIDWRHHQRERKVHVEYIGKTVQFSTVTVHQVACGLAIDRHNCLNVLYWTSCDHVCAVDVTLQLAFSIQSQSVHCWQRLRGSYTDCLSVVDNAVYTDHSIDNIYSPRMHISSQYSHGLRQPGVNGVRPCQWKMAIFAPPMESTPISRSL